MSALQRPLRRGFLWFEQWLDRFFGPAWNPMYNLGALGFFYYWIVAVSGIYVYIFFDTGTTQAYQSVEYMTVDQWYLGGVMRSLHRYASDGMVLIHILNHIDKDNIDMRTVNKGSNLNIYKVRENLDQAFAVSRGIIKIVGVDTQSFLDKTSYLMLGVLWQLVRIMSMKDIDLGDCPQIYRLLQDGEELADLAKLKPEDILIRWMNFHLKAAN